MIGQRGRGDKEFFCFFFSVWRVVAVALLWSTECTPHLSEELLAWRVRWWSSLPLQSLCFLSLSAAPLQQPWQRMALCAHGNKTRKNISLHLV